MKWWHEAAQLASGCSRGLVAPTKPPQLWLMCCHLVAMSNLIVHIKEQDAVLWLARTCISETRSNSRNFSVRCQHPIGPSQEVWIIKRLWTREPTGSFPTQPHGGFSLLITSHSPLFPSPFTRSFHLGVSVLLPLLSSFPLSMLLLTTYLIYPLIPTDHMTTLM